MEPTLAVVATTFGVLMAISPLLQIRRIRAERTSRGVSTTQLAILVAGFAIWLSYGLAAASWPLIISNAVAVVAHSFWLATAHRFRPREA